MLRLTIKCNITYASQLKVKSWRSAGKHHKKCHLHVCADTSRFLRLAIFIQRRFRPKKKKKWTGKSPRRDCLGYRDRIIVGSVDFTATLIPSGWKTDGCKSHNYCIVWKIRRFYPLHPSLDPIAMTHPLYRLMQLSVARWMLFLSLLLVEIYFFL